MTTKNATREMERIQEHAARIARGDEKVKPGEPVRFTTASVVGDTYRQGDLYLQIADNKPPKGYVECEKPLVQLVPGNTVGARHCLDGTVGVRMWVPKEFTEDSLEGPYFQLTEERTVLHPTHGQVSIPAGFSVQCHFQREWDREQEKERRARD